MWMGILESSDQKPAMKHLRQRVNESLSCVGFALQDQPMIMCCGAENTTARKIRPNWDSHEDLIREDLTRDHGYWGAVLDTGASALLKDLKQQGMLDDTLLAERVSPPLTTNPIRASKTAGCKLQPAWRRLEYVSNLVIR